MCFFVTDCHKKMKVLGNLASLKKLHLFISQNKIEQNVSFLNK